MKGASLLRRWIWLALACAAGFVAGYVSFYPGWKAAPRLTNGSVADFQNAARQIEAGDLLGKATPSERVGWLLEICKQPPSLQRDRALNEAIQHMQPADFLTAVADLERFGREMTEVEPALFDHMIEAAVERWLDVDEAGALRWLGASRAVADSGLLKPPTIDASDVQTVFASLALRTPDRALELALKLGDNTQREAGIGEAFRICARQDPRKAREWLERVKGTPDWRSALKSTVFGMSEADPAAAFELATAQDARLRDDVLPAVMYQAGLQSSALATDLMAKIPAQSRARLIGNVVNAMAEKSPGDAMAWMEQQLTASPEVNTVDPRQVTPGIYSLVARDGAATMAWIQGLPEGQRGSLLGGALNAWGNTDPASLLDWLSAQSPEKLPSNPGDLASCARHAPERFNAWVASLPSGPARDSLLMLSATQLAADGKIQEALQEAPATLQSADGARKFAALISSQDVAAARKWFEALPEGAFQRDAAQGMVQTWAAQSPAEAAEWLNTLPPGQLRDSASAAFATACVTVDPKAATAWFARIENPATMEAAVGNLYTLYSVSDQHAAREWLLTLPGLSESVKTRLLAKRP